ncbi:serine/threonine-protein kinase [Saccharomonospora piscinae]|uniref:serine/threonine-protein kinase n=1 Tax=Saccharomonospora piscinae TaxID=687388 RepID=UPI00046415F2|nr:serine/threonine-protein kinase [Saccharomonospora piscinae]
MTNAGEGTVLAGRYRLRREVGSGAMGTVWQAVDERLGRQVAVKRLLLPPGSDATGAAQARERARREGRIAARLHHPHAVTVHDVVEHDGLPVLVMEYFPSRSLADLLATEGPLAPPAAATLGAQVASALAAAHDAGIVHRDVKPANVLIGADGTAKLVDFGIAHAGGDVTVTQTGVVAGTPAYLAPEVARGGPPTPASDVFSLGSLLFALVEGTPPFGSEHPTAEENALGVLHRVAAGTVPQARRAGPLAPVLSRVLVADPAGRPGASTVRDALRAVARGQAPSLEPAPEEMTQPLPAVGAGAPRGGTRLDLAAAPGPEGRPRRSRRGVLLAAGGGLAVVATAAVAVALVSDGDTRRADAVPPPAPATSSTALGAAKLTGVVEDYYGHLPGDTGAAYALLGPALRAQGERGFADDWGGVRSVNVISPARVTGQDTVHVGIRLTRRSGATVTRFHQHGVGRHDGEVVIVSDTVLHAETQEPPPENGKKEKKDKGPGKGDERDKEKGKDGDKGRGERGRSDD